jgi:hypothetical protein
VPDQESLGKHLTKKFQVPVGVGFLGPKGRIRTRPGGHMELSWFVPYQSHRKTQLSTDLVVSPTNGVAGQTRSKPKMSHVFCNLKHAAILFGARPGAATLRLVFRGWF